MNRALLFPIVGVCAVGLAAGFGLRPLLFPAARVAIYPRTIEFKDGHIQGEPLETHFELKNESRSTVTVTSLSSSCGCMVLSGKDGPLKTPFSLAAGAALPITLSVATGGRVGPQVFRLSATAEAAFGAPAKALARVRVKLLAALRAQPAMILFRRAKTGAPLAAEVKLADMLPDPGVRIREVRVSNEKTMRVEVQGETGPSDMFGESATAQARATLKLSYVPDATEGRIQEMISIVPEDARFAMLQIPVYCEIAQPRSRLIPQALTVPADHDAEFRRTVWFDSDTADAMISLASAPAGIKVDIGQGPSAGKAITISGKTSDLDGSSAVVFLINGDEVRFPIRIAPIEVVLDSNSSN
jgi:hypothetical protein